MAKDEPQDGVGAVELLTAICVCPEPSRWEAAADFPHQGIEVEVEGFPRDQEVYLSDYTGGKTEAGAEKATQHQCP